jgi:hypothetical protein
MRAAVLQTLRCISPLLAATRRVRYWPLPGPLMFESGRRLYSASISSASAADQEKSVEPQPEPSRGS